MPVQNAETESQSQRKSDYGLKQSQRRRSLQGQIQDAVSHERLDVFDKTAAYMYSDVRVSFFSQRPEALGSTVGRGIII